MAHGYTRSEGGQAKHRQASSMGGSAVGRDDGAGTETSPEPLRYRARTFSGAGDGNRTRVISLEGWGSTIELRPHMVGTTGFEPAASCSQSTRATRLRHVPTSGVALYGFWRVRATGEWVESTTATRSGRRYTCCVCALGSLSLRATTPVPFVMTLGTVPNVRRCT